MDVVSQSTLADTIKKNSHTLMPLGLQLDTLGTTLLAPVIKKCKMLKSFGAKVSVGSYHTTTVLADILGPLNSLTAWPSHVIWTASAFRPSYAV